VVFRLAVALSSHCHTRLREFGTSSSAAVPLRVESRRSRFFFFSPPPPLAILPPRGFLSSGRHPLAVEFTSAAVLLGPYGPRAFPLSSQRNGYLLKLIALDFIPFFSLSSFPPATMSSSFLFQESPLTRLVFPGK